MLLARVGLWAGTGAATSGGGASALFMAAVPATRTTINTVPTGAGE